MRRTFYSCILLLGSACMSAPDYVYGEPITGLTLSLYSENEGVYPDVSVLEDPNNPFSWTRVIGDQTKWDIQESGGPVAAFYVWATVLARTPFGEAQYYVGLNLQAIFETGMARQQDLSRVRELAILAYQSMLDNYPDAVTYDASGRIAYELATPAVKAIQALGGTVAGGWVVVPTSAGGERAVRP